MHGEELEETTKLKLNHHCTGHNTIHVEDIFTGTVFSICNGHCDNNVLKITVNYNNMKDLKTAYSDAY